MTLTNALRRALAVGALLVGGTSVAGAALEAPDLVPAELARGDAAVQSDWIAKEADNICGLRDPKTLSNPAKVDFDKLMKATPEMKRIDKEGIDPKSAEGIQLRAKAVDRVTKASKAVMGERGNCSVWKKIRHKDGRTIPDITSTVESRLGTDTE